MKTFKIRNRLISIIVLTFFCVIFFSSCENEEYEYQPPEYLKITGVSSVTANSTKDYYTFYLDDANYVWSVPSGASITSGQGTSHIEVLFGDTGGTISVEAKGMNASIEVTIL